MQNRKRIISKRLSQKDLASLIGVDVSFIYKVEKNVTLEKIILISEVLKIDIEVLKILFYSNKIANLLRNENDDLN